MIFEFNIIDKKEDYNRIKLSILENKATIKFSENMFTDISNFLFKMSILYNRFKNSKNYANYNAGISSINGTETMVIQRKEFESQKDLVYYLFSNDTIRKAIGNYLGNNKAKSDHKRLLRIINNILKQLIFNIKETINVDKLSTDLINLYLKIKK